MLPWKRLIETRLLADVSTGIDANYSANDSRENHGVHSRGINRNPTAMKYLNAARALLISFKQQLLIYHPVFYSILIPAREEFSLPPLTRASIPAFRDERVFLYASRPSVFFSLIIIQSRDYDRLTYRCVRCVSRKRPCHPVLRAHMRNKTWQSIGERVNRVLPRAIQGERGRP